MGTIEIAKRLNQSTIFLIGDLTYKSSQNLLDEIKKLNSQNLIFDLSKLKEIDYFFALSIYNITRRKKISFNIINSNSEFDKIFKLIQDKNIDFDYKPAALKNSIFYDIGKYIVQGLLNVLNLLSFIGEFIIKLLALIKHPKNLRTKEISNYFKTSGIDAVFIVGLTSFLVGIVLVYIGANMLAQFGASIYVIDIMGMMTLREIGPLIAAIVIAGRSASSFTAQIGVMKLTEEVDAMKTMGFDPFYFLVMPRVIAMTFSVPFVIFLADGISIIGQMMVCKTNLGVSFIEYLQRFKENIEIKNFFLGLIKAPVFGAVIAMIGCMRGLEVSGDTESVGKFTTLSVVNAIFWVIAIDAIFAIIFSELGL